MRKNSIKNTRVNGEVQRELSNIIRGGIKDPRVAPMTSVVAVEVAPDLKTCKAYISVFGDEKAQADTDREYWAQRKGQAKLDAENKEKLYELVSTEPYYQEMDEDAFDIVSMYTNSKELVGMKVYEGKEGKKDVCQAIKDLMADSRLEGREEGMLEGIEQNKLENARNLLGLLSDEIIAEKIGLPLERVKSLHVRV